ncbi:class I SAM-dependent methyltransferase [Halalkalibacter krulwichiae]|uniref:Demethylrebeccamycin-D-glucose O-methyltransferase n=1 Tax=Halalkalibacter krulwichiae TaxID=199441 RepID=A0A1X9MEY5_9BACI|nr:class I SAM-dependent methyltransferase [Halalkalibacter krulwichiae]ARK30683.1 Demethylrebeccamycin-D-glucose O-methyltransferase [Halalkalibacter krulwichiae]
MRKYSYLDFLAELEVNHAHPGGAASSYKMFENEDLDETKTVLDLGCGLGGTVVHLANTYKCNIYGVDNHSTMVKKAKDRIANQNLNAKILMASVENLPFKKETFDLIVVESVLSFVDITKALSECMRTLKKGGTLILNEMIVLQSISKEEQTRLKDFYQFSECNQDSDWVDLLINHGYIRIERLMFNDSQENEGIELELKPSIDPLLFDILDEHEKLMSDFKGKIGNVVLRCHKKND